MNLQWPVHGGRLRQTDKGGPIGADNRMAGRAAEQALDCGEEGARRVRSCPVFLRRISHNSSAAMQGEVLAKGNP